MDLLWLFMRSWLLASIYILQMINIREMALFFEFNACLIHGMNCIKLMYAFGLRWNDIVLCACDKEMVTTFIFYFVIGWRQISTSCAFVCLVGWSFPLVQAQNHLSCTWEGNKQSACQQHRMLWWCFKRNAHLVQIAGTTKMRSLDYCRPSLPIFL
jgi:hypothetical protein